MATADLTVIALGRDMGTSPDGTTEHILEVVGELHSVPLRRRVYTVLKLDDRRDREQTLEDEVGSVREQP